MHQSMLASLRELGVLVRLTLPTGAVLSLSGGDVLSFSVSEGADSPLLPGNVLSAQMTLELANGSGQWAYGGTLRGERPLVGATAELFIISQGEELPCGVYIVDSVSAKERSGCVTLKGADAVSSELGFLFVDTLVYPTTLQQVWEHAVAQSRFVWAGEIPGGAAVIDRRPDWGEVSLRKVLGWVAQAAGCFVRVGRTGRLEIVPCRADSVLELNPDHYISLTDGFEDYGPVMNLYVTPKGAEDEDSFTVSAGAGETVSVSKNPLFLEGGRNVTALAQGMLAQIAGLTLSRAEFIWRGEPSVSVGSRVRITDTCGDGHLCTVTRQTLKFDRGFSSTCVCEVPDAGDDGVMRAITPEGGVNASALVGTVNGGLLAADSVTARSIAAGAVTAEKLAAGSVVSDAIAAEAVTAEKLEAASVSGATAQFVSAKLMEITSSDIATNELYSAFAHLIELAAGSVSAGEIDADRLAAALADVVSLHAGTGDFDLATVRNLLANALVLQQGAADSMMISNLAVTGANLLSAVIGELVLKGADGGYYRIAVGSDGVVHASETAVTGGEIQAGETSSGLKIAETDVNVRGLDAQSVRAASAAIAQIVTETLSAGKITAGQALIASATIPALYTAVIRSIGDSLDLSGNKTVQVLLETDGNVRRWFRFDDGGMTAGKPGSTYTTRTDDTGYHVLQLGETIGSFARRQLAAENVRVGRVNTFEERYVLREAPDGGLLITKEGLT